MNEIEFLHYDTPEDIIDAFLDRMEEGVELFNEKGSIIAFDGSELSREEMIEAADEQGCWAFSDTVEGVIHVWFADDLPLINRVEVFAHELTHILAPEFNAPKLPEDDDEEFAAEEARCELVSEIAMIAYEKATELREV